LVGGEGKAGAGNQDNVILGHCHRGEEEDGCTSSLHGEIMKLKKGRKVADFGVEKGIIWVLEKAESSWAKNNEGRRGPYISIDAKFPSWSRGT
jgi:hypothetical protein